MDDDSGESAERTSERTARRLRGCRHGKQQGQIAELGFVYKAAKMGFAVAKPYGDNERYDFIVDAGKRLWRVQVKSTYAFVDGTCYKLGAYWKSISNTHISYTPEQVDFLVGHVVPEDAWYVIPIDAVALRKSLRLYPSRDVHGGRYEKYREAWHLMAVPAVTGDENAPVK
jgi:hypothetical protein